MRARFSTELPFACGTCEIEIAGTPTFQAGVPFCCPGCAAGGPCACSYDPPPSDSRIRECLDVVVAGGGEPSSRVIEPVAGGQR
jgi:hypothetical protein